MREPEPETRRGAGQLGREDGLWSDSINTYFYKSGSVDLDAVFGNTCSLT